MSGKCNRATQEESHCGMMKEKETNLNSKTIPHDCFAIFTLERQMNYKTQLDSVKYLK